VKTDERRIAKMASTRPFKRVSDRRVRRELRRAAFHAALAARRAQSVGPARASGDRRVTRGFQRSTRHAARALSFSISPPSHRMRNTVLIVTGAATTVVAVVAIRSKPWQSSDDAAPATESTAAEANAAEAEEPEAELTPSSTATTGSESVQ
jgi:hypothetical protein